ncbi:MAG: bacteriocin biosynthesis protein [Peptoclostridium sp.]|uniref:BhlA/UviB family holin-like peptide n=1 Tax=Peptoclostridium sp. TaxID=1904860 RepID=UPI00139C31D2|nr:BhlA/UviB family holin-like peptide [Peptoclostridium sp.]MZQ75277.1 bacteriocin biosynthesis protein [Peptoclostridium sp.]
MEAKIFEMATQQGLTAVLFVALFWHTLKTSNDREMRLQAVIDNNQRIMGDMVAKLDTLDSIKDDVDDIKVSLNATAATINATAATRLP